MTITDTDAKLLRAWVYARVSHDNQKTGSSVEEQIDGCLKVVTGHADWTLAHEPLFDNDVSASEYASKHREKWELIVTAIDAGEVDVLVLWEPSRATRDEVVWAQLSRICARKGVLICLNGRLYDPSDPHDAFQLSLFFALAQLESRTVRKRVKRSLDARAERGWMHAHTPYGYQRTYDQHTRALLAQDPHPEHAPVVREIFRRYAAGIGLRQIANWLDDTHEVIATKANVRARCWYPEVISKILKNPVYIGKRTNKGREIDAIWEPLIDLETWYAVQRRFAEVNARPRAIRTGRLAHLLTSILKCGVCGLNLTARHVRHGGELHRTAYQCPKGCVSLDEAATDKFITDVVVGWLSRPDVYDKLVAPDDEATALARAALNKARVEHVELRALAASGGLSVALAANLEPALLQRIKSAEDEVSKAGLPKVLRDVVGPQAAAQWATLAMASQREIIRTLMTIELHKPAKARARLDLARLYITWLV